MRFLQAYIALVSLSIVSPAANAESARSLRIFSDYSFIDGRSGRNGHDLNATGLYKYYQSNWLELGYSSLGKSYSNVPMRYDQLWRIGHSWNFNPQGYFYSYFDKNFSQHYGADWSLYGEPHYLPSADLDIGLGAHWKSYPVNHALALKPLASISLLNRMTIYMRSDIALKPERAISAEGNLEYQIVPKLAVRAGGGGGKSDEGDGLLDKFKQFTTLVAYQPVDRLKVKAMFQLYRGDLRRENRFGGGIEITAF